MNRIWALLACLIIFPSAFLKAETYTVELGQFEKLKINGNIRVVYSNLPDSTGYARYEAPFGSENFFDFVKKNDGSLKLQPSDENWGAADLPVVFLYSDFISSIESYSELSVVAQSLTPCSSLTVKLIGNGSITIDNAKCTNINASITTGNGTINISGSCINASFSMVGAGLISADRLVAENVKCRILGTGSIGCWPVDNLSVTGLGSTKIYYKGKPNIKKTGGGKLLELPEDNVSTHSRQGAELKSLSPVEEEVEEDDEEEIEKEDSFEEVEEVTAGDNDEDFDYQTVVTDDD